jgi:hypothetical protein
MWRNAASPSDPSPSSRVTADHSVCDAYSMKRAVAAPSPASTALTNDNSDRGGRWRQRRGIGERRGAGRHVLASGGALMSPTPNRPQARPHITPMTAGLTRAKQCAPRYRQGCRDVLSIRRHCDAQHRIICGPQQPDSPVSAGSDNISNLRIVMPTVLPCHCQSRVQLRA